MIKWDNLKVGMRLKVTRPLISTVGTWLNAGDFCTISKLIKNQIDVVDKYGRIYKYCGLERFTYALSNTQAIKRNTNMRLKYGKR